MAAKRFQVHSLFGAVESTFNVDPDPDGSDYKWLRASNDATWSPTRNVIERDLQTNMTRLPHLMGHKTGQLTFKLDLKGSGTPGTAATIPSEAAPLLTAAFGTPDTGTGTTVNDAGATTTSFDVTSAAGLKKGMMVFVDCGSYGYVPRFITNIASNTITLDRALPAAPADTVAVIATTLYARRSSGQKSVAFVAVRDGITHTFLGCKLDSLAIEGNSPGGVPKLAFTYSVTTWVANDSAKNALPSQVPTGITAVIPPIVKGSCFAYNAAEEPVYDFALDFGLNYVFQDSTCAGGVYNEDSINADQVLISELPTGSMKPYYAAGHLTDYTAGTERSLAFACGPHTGNAWGLYIPKAQLTSVADEDHNGMLGENIAFSVNDNGSDPILYLSIA